MQSLKFTDILDNTRNYYTDDELLSPCSETEHIVDFVYGDLDENSVADILHHIKQCATCGLTLLKIEADLTQWELEIANSPEKAIAKALGVKGRKMVQQMFHPKSMDKALSSAKDAVLSWVSQVWAPKWAGQTVTAVDIPEQQHHFDMDDGEYVNLKCQWEGNQIQKIPYIRISWNANIFSPSNIWLHFVDIDKKSIIDQLCLGTDLEGVSTLTKPDIQFDPSLTKWGLRVLVEPVE